jgi:hypothetical protein
MLRRAAQILLAAIFVVSVYRAITQSIGCDEAVTFQLYIAGPASAMFQHFDANHHFLNTLLMRLTTGLFGLSEFSMRLPALSGAALYLTAVYRVAGLAFGEGWTILLAVAGLSLNPLLMDFMVAARRYGIALGLWMWALALLLGALPSPREKRRELALAGAALGLAVTANLVFLLPALGLAAIAAFILIKAKPEPVEPRKKRDKSKTAEGMRPWMCFAAPIAAVALVFVLLAPVGGMTRQSFYVGGDSIRDSLTSLVRPSLQHSGPLRYVPLMMVWFEVVALSVAPLVFAIGLIIGLLQRRVSLLLAAGPAVFSAVALG